MTKAEAIEVLKECIGNEFGHRGMIDLDEVVPATNLAIAALNATSKPLHSEAWWRTYNAALTGLYAQRGRNSTVVHEEATEAADLAHGPLDGAK